MIKHLYSKRQALSYLVSIPLILISSSSLLCARPSLVEAESDLPSLTSPMYMGFEEYLTFTFEDNQLPGYWSVGDTRFGETACRETTGGSVVDGILKLEVTPLGGGGFRCSELRGNGTLTYGLIEAKMKTPQAGNGFIGSIFTYPNETRLTTHSAGLPFYWREFDIEFEGIRPGFQSNYIVGDFPGPGHSTLEKYFGHLKNSDRIEDRRAWENGWAKGLPIRWDTTTEWGRFEFNHQNPEDTSSDFHRYAIAWGPNRVRWFVDGICVREETGQSIKERQQNGRPRFSLEDDSMGISNKPANVRVNFWAPSAGVSNDFGGDPTQNNGSIYMEYDWIRILKLRKGGFMDPGLCSKSNQIGQWKYPTCFWNEVAGHVQCNKN